MPNRNPNQRFERVPADPMPGYAMLVNLQQLQDHQVSLAMSGETIDCIRGAVDRIRWPELHTVLDAIKAGLVRASQVVAERLVCTPYLTIQGSGWSPGLELWVELQDERTIDLKKVNAIVELVLIGLQRDFSNTTNDFATELLEPIEREAVRQVVSETLSSAGGKRLALPIFVQLDQQPLLKLDGKFGAKPSQANFHAEERILNGRFVGFDLTKNELLFLTAEKKIAVNFDPRQVDLQDIASAASNGRDCTIRTHRTISANGSDVHAYVSAELIEKSPSSEVILA